MANELVTKANNAFEFKSTENVKMGYKDGRGSVSITGDLHCGSSNESVVYEGRVQLQKQGSMESNCFDNNGSKDDKASTCDGSEVGADGNPLVTDAVMLDGTEGSTAVCGVNEEDQMDSEIGGGAPTFA